MSFKSYSHYNDSGVEWIGEIPEGWNVEKLKFNSEINLDSLPENYDLDYEFFYLDISNVSKNGEIINTDLMRFEDAPSRARRIPKSQNTIISTVRTYLKAITYLDDIPKNFIVSTGFCVLNPHKNIFPIYLYYLVSSDLFVQTIVAYSKGIAYPAINSSDLANLPIWYPDIETQNKISSFLDKKTSEIDLTIEKDARLIELLKEKRAALINHVVTKGLDPTVKMKDSGVEWIGEIPEIWEARKIKTFSVVRRGASPRPIDDPKYFDEEGEYSWVRIADVTASSKYLYNTTEKLSILGKSFSVPLEPDELFISIAGSVGKPIIAKIKCCIHDGFVYFQDLKLDPEYLYYIFIGGQAFQGLGKLGTQLNLNTETIGNIKIPHPSKEEQKEITQFLDRKTSKINETIEKIQNKINLLEEYKKSLIHHVVTGKVDVREVAV